MINGKKTLSQKSRDTVPLNKMWYETFPNPNL